MIRPRRRIGSALSADWRYFAPAQLVRLCGPCEGRGRFRPAAVRYNGDCQPGSSMNRRRKRNRPAAVGDLPSDTRPAFGAALAVCCLLVLAVWLAFGQTLQHEFVNCDDGLYVSDNPLVVRGLSLQRNPLGLYHHAGRQLASPDLALADARRPILRTAALGIPLDRRSAARRHGDSALPGSCGGSTGHFCRRPWLAAVFAVHPLRAESVAWAAERKDVLSGLFFMLTLAAYLGYVRRPSSLDRELLVVGGVRGRGLMAKPSVVTLPFVLLLLDYWPLGRIGDASRGAVAGRAARPASGRPATSFARRAHRGGSLWKRFRCWRCRWRRARRRWRRRAIRGDAGIHSDCVPSGERPDFLRLLRGPVVPSG